MFFLRQFEKPSGPICDWLVANKQQVLAGTAELDGVQINDSTEFRQYGCVVSICVMTFTPWSSYDLPRAQNNNLRVAFWLCTLGSLLLGWWAFPWGPPLTLHALWTNLRGGRKRTAGSLLQQIEWGWDAPPDASASGYQKKIIEVTTEAAEEIRARKVAGKFPEEVGVRIVPSGFADDEVRVAFDYPVSDGRDWVDSSAGLILLVDKNHEPQFAGRRLEFQEGRFRARL